jgi:hypothetical protein
VLRAHLRLRGLLGRVLGVVLWVHLVLWVRCVLRVRRRSRLRRGLRGRLAVIVFDRSRRGVRGVVFWLPL